MGTINGCGTMFYGEDRLYLTTVTTQQVISPEEASKRNSTIMNELLFNLTPRKKTLLAKTELTQREANDLKGLN